MDSIEYDKGANAMYFRLTDGKRKIRETLSLGEDKFLDVDEFGRIIGLEVILPKKMPEEFDEVIARSKEYIQLIQ
jgi:uncharacterized protein YuzE